jgi:transposase-like protein
LAVIEAEGVTTKAYAAREGVPVTSLYYWRRRLKSEAAGRPAAVAPDTPHFMAMDVGRRRAQATCTVTVADNVRMELDAMPSPQWLAALAEAMR